MTFVILFRNNGKYIIYPMSFVLIIMIIKEYKKCFDIDFRIDSQRTYVGIWYHNGMGSQRSIDAGIRHGILLSL